MNEKPINIKVNYTNGRHNYISLPARFGSITTNVFIYANSLKQIYKTANEHALKISSKLNINVNPAHLVQCLEIGVTAFLLNQWGYVSEMEMSREFVLFYNVAACAFLSNGKYAECEIDFCSDGEFMKMIVSL